MSFQAKTNQIISAVGQGVNTLESANAPSVEKIQSAAKAVKPSYDEQVAQMANNLAKNLITTKNNQMNNFNDYVSKLSSNEWLDQAVNAEKRKNKLEADALLQNALKAEEIERSVK